MPINPVSNSYSTTTSTTPRNTSAELGEDAFLSLLVTQLQYQDPLNPMDNTEYISQLAQFSALEQMTNVSEGVNSLHGLLMMGKYISATVTGSSGETSIVQGVVESVRLSAGEVILNVEGTEVNLDDVTYIGEETPSAGD